MSQVPPEESLNSLLTPLSYAIGILGEEGSEVAHAAMKVARFGLLDTRPSNGKTNLQTLQDELTDIMAAVELVNRELRALALPELRIDDTAGIAAKIAKVEHFAQRSIQRGTLLRPLAGAIADNDPPPWSN